MRFSDNIKLKAYLNINGLPLFLFLAKMRQDPEIAHIPVVALSNYDEPKTKTEAFKLGAKNYLIKTDFTPATLIKEVRKYLPSA